LNCPTNYWIDWYETDASSSGQGARLPFAVTNATKRKKRDNFVGRSPNPRRSGNAVARVSQINS
jgi:hypothetical protein